MDAGQATKHEGHGHEGHSHGAAQAQPEAQAGSAPGADVDPKPVSLSAKAAEKVKEIRQQENIEASYGLRLRIVGGGCSGFSYDLYFDQATESDQKLESYGLELIVDPMSMQYLMGTEIDYVEGLYGAGFKFGNPNVKSTCGCGSSFGV